MPKIKYFEKDLTNVNIRTKDYNAIKKLQGKNEPFYRCVQRIVNLVTNDHLELDEEMKALTDSVRTWQKRAFEAETKLNGIQRQLV